MISLIKKLSIFIFIFQVIACANVQSPSGGPSDNTSPTLKGTKPEQNTVNFKGKVIVLDFDEEVNADKINNTLVITPYKDDDFKVRTKKRTITLTFDKEFEPNTTYTLNFGDAITDLTEKNPAKDLTLAFSTGSYIDSIFLNGNVTDLKTNIPLDNITVALYKSGDSTSLKTGKPIYFDKTDKSGTFNFKNLKNNIYNIYAFQDKNSNLHYEESEKIGFLENFNLTKNKSSVNISVTMFDTKAPEISFISPGKEKTDIKFNEGIVLQKINYTDSTQIVLYTISEDAKTISVFNHLNIYDSIPLQLIISDSTGNEAQIKRKIIFEKKTSENEPFSLKIEPTDYKLDPGYINVTFLFNKPVKEFTKSITVNANHSIIQLEESNYTWNPTRTRLLINKKIKTVDTILIETKKNTFISIPGDSLNIQKLTFTLKKEEDYGMIRGSTETKETDYILELTDEKYKTLKSIKNIKAFNFTYLKPGNYFIRVIIDENKNGQWDNGNLIQKKEPEKIIYYKEKIQLRANWEVENILIKF